MVFIEVLDHSSSLESRGMGRDVLFVYVVIVHASAQRVLTGVSGGQSFSGHPLLIGGSTNPIEHRSAGAQRYVDSLLNLAQELLIFIS